MENTNGAVRRPKLSQFKTVEEFWSFYDENPGAFSDLSPHEVAQLSYKVLDRSREENGKTKEKQDGNKREENGNMDTPAENAPESEERVGRGNPPKQHQFKPGNPGGPGRPKGARSMRALIRGALFDDEMSCELSKAVLKSLFREALAGNTHALRIIVDKGSPRLKKQY